MNVELIKGKSHSGLHAVKRKKMLLSTTIATMRTKGRRSLGLPHEQSALAHLRSEFRAYHLADCYMRGRSIGQVEQSMPHLPPRVQRVIEIVESHGGAIVTMPLIQEWLHRN